MSTELDLDIAALVGEMEAPGCEHSQHGINHGFAGEPATHYIRTSCTCGEDCVYAGCEAVVHAVLADRMMGCACGLQAPASVFSTILGPVNK